MQRPALRDAVLHAVVATVATWPLALSPLSRLVGHEDVDVWNHAWGAWWFAHAFSVGAVPWHTGLLAAPRGGVLWFIDPIGALAQLPLLPILGVVGAYNTVLWVWNGLASVAGRRLALALGAPEGASWAGAVGVAASPFLVSELHNGISEAAAIQWLVFTLVATRRALTDGRTRSWAMAGVWLGVTGIGTWYYGFAAGVTVAAWALLTGRRDALRGAALAGALGAALAVPVMLLVGASVRAADTIVARGAIDPWNLEFVLAHNAVDPVAFWAPGGFQSVDLASRGEAFRHSSYLGLVAFALALAAWRPRVGLGLIPAATLSLGVYLFHDGHWVEWRPDGRWLLPFGLLLRVLPEAGATHAQRFVVPVVVTTAALAAVGLGRLPRWTWPLGIAALAGDALSNAPWPLSRSPELDLAAHRALAAEKGIVVDVPTEVGWSMATSRYLVYQTASGRPIPYRVDARGSTASFLGRGWFTLLRADSTTGPEHTMLLDEAQGRQDTTVAAIRKAGVSAFVLHPELDRGTGAAAALEAQLRTWFGEPETIGSHLVWRVPQD